MSSLLPPAQQREDQPEAVCHAMHYTAVFGTIEQFAPAVWPLAVDQNVPYAGRVTVVADESAGTGNLAADLFPASTPSVDWYHATPHLADAAPRRTHPLKDLLIKDEAWNIIAALHQADLAHHAAYFEAHRSRIV